MNSPSVKNTDLLLNKSNLLIAIGREFKNTPFTPESLLDRLNNCSAYYFQSGASRQFTSRDFLTQVLPLLLALETRGLVEKIDPENYRVSQSGLAALRSVSEY